MKVWVVKREISAKHKTCEVVDLYDTEEDANARADRENKGAGFHFVEPHRVRCRSLRGIIR